MKESSANIMRQGKRAIRALNDVCDASCACWFCCSNSQPNGTCKGFVILNGKSRMLLDKNLKQDDLIYIQNCAQMAQGDCNDETRTTLVQEVLRFLPETEPEPRTTGFTAMLNASRQSNPPSEHTDPEREERARSGFSAMLSASSKGKKTDEEAVERALDEIAADEVKYATTFEKVLQTNPEDIVPRNGIVTMLERTCASRANEAPQPEPQTRLGFLRMLDPKYQAYIASESEETHRYIPHGFRESIDALSHARRGRE